MPERVTILKDGFYRADWVPDIKDYHISKVPDNSEIFLCLRSPVELEPDVTLGDVMKTVHRNNRLECILGLYSHCASIEQFHYRLDNARLQPIDSETTSYLKVYKVANIITNKDGTIFDDFYEFVGVGKDGIEYCMSLTPIEEMLNLPIKIDETFSIYKSDYIQHISDELIAETQCPISLLDFLDAIYYEISFFGGPEKREEVKKRMSDLAEEAIDEHRTKLWLEELHNIKDT